MAYYGNNQVNNALNALKDFVKYLSSAWGLMSIFTPIFPLIDAVSRLLPPPEEHAELFKVAATLCGLFTIFYYYSTREDYLRDIWLTRKASWEFFAALILLVLYTVILFPQQLLSELRPEKEVRALLEPALYIAIFFLFTKSFTALGVWELGKWSQNNKSKP